MDIEAALADLEAAIRRRRKWRGKPVFYQVLDYELAPILAAAADPEAIRQRVRALLERHGHDPDPPPLPGAKPDLGHLCNTSPSTDHR